MSPLRIAIVGAGPVGLTLARLLLNKPDIEVTVFESEKSREVREQGGTLDLHTDTGLAAVKEAGLYDEFLKNARFDGEAMVICDKRLTKYVNFPGQEEGSTRGRPEIDRKMLREMLLDSVPPEIIRWGYHLRSIDESRNLVFDQGTESGFDLVVGAEGAWSKTRKLVSTQKPNYSGVTGITFTIPNAKETAPECYSLTNRGSVFSYSDGKSIMSQQLGNGSLIVYVWSIRPESWMDNMPFDINDTEAIKKSIREEFQGWHPDLLNCVNHGQDPLPRRLYMLPVGFSWQNRPGVTLIGDSAHVMTPFAGEGVNIGMEDALMLSRAIIKASKSANRSDSLTAEIKTFEKDLFIRAERTTSLTNDMMMWLLFTDGAPRSVVEKVGVRMATFGNSSLVMKALYPFLVASIYTSYFVFKLFH